MDEQQHPAEAAGFLLALTCDRCGGPSGRVEVLPPDQLPERAAAWSEAERGEWLGRWPGEWRIIYRGLTRESGWGGAPVSAEEAAKLRRMFSPFDGTRVLREFRDIGWCAGCGLSYCSRHWRYTRHEDERVCPRGHRVWFD